MVAPMDRTLPALLRLGAERHGGRPLVTVNATTWTVSEACVIAARRGGSLREAGIQRGDRVAALCGNCPELLELVLGCGWIGAVLVPINTAAMGPQIGYYLRDCGARLLVAEHRFLDRLALAGVLPIERIWVVGGGMRAYRLSRFRRWPIRWMRRRCCRVTHSRCCTRRGRRGRRRG